jgi:TFIIF-interacting CTD phosphatase-like protein
MNKLYEVIIFTAGEEYYAKQIIDVLDPEEKLISARLYRDSCTEHNQLYIKDLSRLGRPMSDVLILDNSPYAYYF